jgi:outer membrane receptor protein involved in Fe transport
VRGAAISIDPVTGDLADRVDVLVKARGAELGARYEGAGITASLVAFHLSLDSELVFVGDGGTTEPNAATRRHGVEATLFWRPIPALALDGAAAFTRARFRGVAAGEDRIPNSVGEVISAGATLDLPGGFSGALRLRHFGSAPLIEHGGERSEPTTLVNLGGYWRRGRLRLSADVLNLFDARDPDISYFYASRLPGEPAEGVEDRHIHPVEPRQVRLTFEVNL